MTSDTENDGYEPRELIEHLVFATDHDIDFKRELVLNKFKGREDVRHFFSQAPKGNWCIVSSSNSITIKLFEKLEREKRTCRLHNNCRNLLEGAGMSHIPYPGAGIEIFY